ncbi:MAG: tetratricopeptide repeat protein [Nitrospira sp.]|nr:tetratricopeptide repeat protein [Nitrospira sp.]
MVCSTLGALILLLTCAQVQAAPPIFENLGTLHHPISTTSESAQRYFDQGLRLVYAFNHEEAIRSFEEATKQDPRAAMPYWGVALALGPNINAGMAKDHERRAVEAVRQARSRMDQAGERERAYIDALTKRYGATKGAGRGLFAKAYADAMRLVWRRYQDDPDAGVLFAEALMNLRPWDLWTADGKPKPGTEEIIATLEAVLAQHPDHPGACHYYIHAVEASSQPERALACADRLADLMPGAGHLVHMPAHIYARVGKYHESAEHNAQAAHVDETYLAAHHLAGDYADGYYSHNLHFLWSSLLMEGRSAEAVKISGSLSATISEEEVRKDRSKEQYLPSKLFAWIRFGRWEDLLKEPPPPRGFRLMEGVWRLGRGLALAATGRLPGAAGEHYALAGLTKQIRRTRLPQEKIERDQLKIAERLLAGDLATRHGRYDEAVRALQAAVKLEDAMQYSEPPLWPLSTRLYLGAVLLMAHRPGEAEQVYRADLKRFPENGWALFGLGQSLRAQQQDEEAVDVERRFQAAWSYADVTLTASRF